MNENIFENAKFGDPFLTRDGEKAILWRIDDSFTHKYILVLEDGNCAYCNEEGEDIDDYDDAIVSRYNEPIAETIAENCQKSMEEGYRQGIETAREWLEDHVQSVAFLDHKFSSITYPVLGDKFLLMFDQAMEG